MILSGINFSDFELVLSLIHTCLVRGPRSWTFAKLINSIPIRRRLKMLTHELSWTDSIPDPAGYVCA